MPSTAIRSYHYDAGLQRLRITYISGAVYDYLEVPPEIFAAMKAFKSNGTFINQQIKGRYDFKKVEH